MVTLARYSPVCPWLFQDADIPPRGGRQRRDLAEATPGPTGTEGLQGEHGENKFKSHS